MVLPEAGAADQTTETPTLFNATEVFKTGIPLLVSFPPTLDNRTAEGINGIALVPSMKFKAAVVVAPSPVKVAVPTQAGSWDWPGPQA